MLLRCRARGAPVLLLASALASGADKGHEVSARHATSHQGGRDGGMTYHMCQQAEEQ